MVKVPVILQDVDSFLDRSQALMELFLMLALPGLANWLNLGHQEFYLHFLPTTLPFFNYPHPLK